MSAAKPAFESRNAYKARRKAEKEIEYEIQYEVERERQRIRNARSLFEKIEDAPGDPETLREVLHLIAEKLWGDAAL